MFSVNRYNKGEGSKFNFKLREDAPYKKLSELGEGARFTVRALFISDKGNYGEAPIAISDDMGVYLPSHLNDTVKAMREDPECVQAINQGCVGCKVYSFESQGKTCYSVDWEDIVPTVSNEFPTPAC